MSKTITIVSVKDQTVNGKKYLRGEFIHNHPAGYVPDGFAEAQWQHFVNDKTKDRPKMFLHFPLINKFGLKVCYPPSQYAILDKFTFYRIEKDFIYYITNYDVREDKGGAPDGVIAENCWCLFTFYKGKKALQFLSVEMLEKMSVEQLNTELEKMYKRLQ